MPQTNAGRIAFVAAVAVAFVAGLLAGRRSTAYYQSLGGMSAAFGPVSVIAVALALGLVGLVALLVARLRGAQNPRLDLRATLLGGARWGAAPEAA